jgi:energy-coupling factor transport system ATP-binding protein
MDAIKISNLKFAYDKETNIFSNLSFNVLKGEYVAIIGHNGSGKSTLAKLIIGLLEAQEGTIEIFGQVLNEDSVYDIRKQVGIIFQNPDNQFTGSTVADDIAFGLENHQVPHDQMEGIIQEYASKVGMIDFLKKEPTSLSGGQKQRVAIAGVLAMQPSLVIMDEATAMLDPKGKKEIRDLVKEIRKSNPDLTILSITHDIEEAYDSDRIIVINKGDILYNDCPNEVFKHEEKLLEINLDIPFAHKLKKELAKRDINLKASEEKDMVEELCQ